MLGSGSIESLVFGLWGAPVALLVFGIGGGLFLASFISLFGIRYSSLDILLVEEVDSLASFAS